VKIDSQENKTLVDAGVYEHNDRTCPDKVILPFHGDGLYTVMHIILPTKEWIQGKDLSQYTNVYAYED
jgi:Na+-transporting NADH:ubiquinone oxidoreductase subunit NqrC